VAAYAVTRQGQDPPPSSEELRSFAAGRLAAYKVPEVIVLLPSLPTTGMGKIDRAALQRRAESDMGAKGRYSTKVQQRPLT
jgi:acyl-CoA synthetase (AMP-forming)/AMP-acid ligase II